MPQPVFNGGTKPSPALKAQALLDQSSSDDEESSESEESDSDESGSTAEVPKTDGNLLSMPLSDAKLQTQAKPKPSSNGTSLANDLQGLVMAPVVVESNEKADPNIESDSSEWMTLVRHELGGGLTVTARYLRGPSREREAKLIGMDPEQPSVCLLQVKFENR
jgi:hypothetical protein